MPLTMSGSCSEFAPLLGLGLTKTQKVRIRELIIFVIVCSNIIKYIIIAKSCTVGRAGVLRMNLTRIHKQHNYM